MPISAAASPLENRLRVFDADGGNRGARSAVNWPLSASASRRSALPLSTATSRTAERLRSPSIYGPILPFAVTSVAGPLSMGQCPPPSLPARVAVERHAFGPGRFIDSCQRANPVGRHVAAGRVRRGYRLSRLSGPADRDRFVLVPESGQIEVANCDAIAVGPDRAAGITQQSRRTATRRHDPAQAAAQARASLQAQLCPRVTQTQQAKSSPSDAPSMLRVDSCQRIASSNGPCRARNAS